MIKRSIEERVFDGHSDKVRDALLFGFGANMSGYLIPVILVSFQGF